MWSIAGATAYHTSSVICFDQKSLLCSCHMPVCWPSTSSRTSLLAGCFPLRASGSLRDSGKRFWFCSWVVLQWNSSFEICKKWEHLVLIINCDFKEREELFCPERVNNLVTSFRTFDIWRLIHRINQRISIFRGNKLRSGHRFINRSSVKFSKHCKACFQILSSQR